MADAVLTVEEVAAQLRVSPQTVRKLIEDGDLKAFKVRGQWRVKQSDLDDYIQRQYR
jgi:excisionase family DNA binding protein